VARSALVRSLLPCAKRVFPGLLCGTLTAAQAQVLDPPDCRATDPPVPYVPLREADVMWERRVWRHIDLNDPLNKPFGTPEGRELGGCMGLFGVLRHGMIDEGGITPYAPGPNGEDDGFRSPLAGETLAAFRAMLDTLDPGMVAGFRIKEDWIFDKRRSVMEVRIIGLAPMVKVTGPDGELRGHRPLVWLHYPECRLLLSRWAAMVNNDGGRLSFEKLFASRRFTGTIIKVSNMHDRAVPGHMTGLDALLQSDGLRQQLLEMGFDLWHY
jgi:gliding motility associated protien GldN